MKGLESFKAEIKDIGVITAPMIAASTVVLPLTGRYYQITADAVAEVEQALSLLNRGGIPAHLQGMPELMEWAKVGAGVPRDDHRKMKALFRQYAYLTGLRRADGRKVEPTEYKYWRLEATR